MASSPSLNAAYLRSRKFYQVPCDLSTRYGDSVPGHNPPFLHSRHQQGKIEKGSGDFWREQYYSACQGGKSGKDTKSPLAFIGNFSSIA